MNKNKFSKWVKWEDRNLLKNLEFPGIYALAISRSLLAGQPFSWDSKIVYFGMTNSKAGLNGRLTQFHNTISEKSSQHGGADRFLNDHNYGKLRKTLYVSVAPFKCNVESNLPTDLKVMGKVAQAEYECWAAYVNHHNRLPKYNDKNKSPKYWH